MLDTGDTVPADLALDLSSGSSATLGDYAGQWLVLYFYPKDSTPGCTTEGNDFNTLLPKFRKLGATVLGVSRDSVKSHQNFCAKQVQSNLLPYVVEVVASDKPGILFQLADFFDRQGITIESLHCSRYRAMQTGADMFSAQVTIGVPANMHIAALRDDFLEFCDHLNLDAIMDPMKF